MRVLLPLLILLSACFSRGAMMTSNSFHMISLGTPISQVVTENGQPYAIHRKGGGIEEYEYIERLDFDQELVRETHYFLKVSQGRVVSKRMSNESQPAYDLIYQEDPNYPEFP